jgi:hypothetical protein
MKKSELFTLAVIAMLVIVSIGFVSCGNDDEEGSKPLVVSPSSISMKYDESQQLSASGATSWRSENEFVATVDQNGLVKGNHVGNTDIIVSNGNTSGKCSVTIAPKYNYFDMPILNWGTSETSIRNAETHGTPEKSGDNLLYKYDNRSIPAVVMYSFKNGVLNNVLQITGSSYYANAGYFLIERFQPIGESQGMYIFIDSMSSDTAHTLVGLDYVTLSSTKYAGITYMEKPATLNASSRRSISLVPSDVIDIVEEMLK